MDRGKSVSSVRLVAPRARGAVAVLVVVGATTAAVLGRRFAGDTRAGRTDRVLAGWVEMRHGAVKLVGQGLANLGGPIPIGVALVVLAVLAHRLRGPRGLALVVAGPALAMVTTSLVLKPLIGRTRGGTLAFPSGHTTSVTSTAVTVAVLLLGWAAVPLLVRWLGVVALALLVAGVAASLVGRGYHYPTDTLGGVGVALAVVLAVAVVIDLVADRVSGPHLGTGDEPTVALPSARTEALPTHR